MKRAYKKKNSNRKSKRASYVEDFESSNIQYTDEIGTSFFGIQCLVYTLDNPPEHTLEDGLGQTTHGVQYLGYVLSFVDELSSDLDFGFDQRFVEFTNRDSQ